MTKAVKKDVSEYLPLLKNISIFGGVGEEDILHMLKCRKTVLQVYEKDSYIFREGQVTGSFGMLLSGTVYAVKEDLWGNRSILAKMGVGQLFGESFAFTGGEELTFSVVTAERTVVLFMNATEMLTVCSKLCQCHNRMIQNMVKVMAEANQMLMRKIEHTSQHSTKDKLLSYLSDESRRQKSRSFEIPFNRQQLADYLNVDRSAMSSALGKLRDEGILEFDRNRFTIL